MASKKKTRSKKKPSQSVSNESAKDLLRFIDSSPTPYHAVETSLKDLEGFRLLDEKKPWSLKPGGRYVVTRNNGSLAAFVVGERPVSEAGFRILGAHTDSPNFRLKPHPVYSNEGYAQLGIEVYGGVLLGTWTDRDLSVAGYVAVDQGGGAVQTKLVRLDGPICRIPQLAIHLNRGVNRDGLKLNEQKHLPPIFSLASSGNPEKAFWAAIGDSAGVDPKKIVDFDLQLFDTQPSSLSGIKGEFIHAPRLDNLASCHAALSALKSSTGSGATAVAVLFDHEEVGSRSAQGAQSPFLADILERIAASEDASREAFARGLQRSLVASVDMAHAVHPNYPESHEPRHKPLMGGGPVIKVNHEMSYATTAETSAIFEGACRAAKVPVQKFVVRTDMACGGTIGSITAAKLGIRTVDVGNPLLSMHSIREMAGSEDHPRMIRALVSFLKVPV